METEQEQEGGCQETDEKVVTEQEQEGGCQETDEKMETEQEQEGGCQETDEKVETEQEKETGSEATGVKGGEDSSSPKKQKKEIKHQPARDPHQDGAGRSKSAEGRGERGGGSSSENVKVSPRLLFFKAVAEKKPEDPYSAPESVSPPIKSLEDFLVQEGFPPASLTPLESEPQIPFPALPPEFNNDPLSYSPCKSSNTVTAFTPTGSPSHTTTGTGGTLRARQRARVIRGTPKPAAAAAAASALQLLAEHPLKSPPGLAPAPAAVSFAPASSSSGCSATSGAGTGPAGTESDDKLNPQRSLVGSGGEEVGGALPTQQQKSGAIPPEKGASAGPFAFAGVTAAAASSSPPPPSTGASDESRVPMKVPPSQAPVFGQMAAHPLPPALVASSSGLPLPEAPLPMQSSGLGVTPASLPGGGDGDGARSPSNGGAGVPWPSSGVFGLTGSASLPLPDRGAPGNGDGDGGASLFTFGGKPPPFALPALSLSETAGEREEKSALEDSGIKQQDRLVFFGQQSAESALVARSPLTGLGGETGVCPGEGGRVGGSGREGAGVSVTDPLRSRCPLLLWSLSTVQDKARAMMYVSEGAFRDDLTALWQNSHAVHGDRGSSPRTLAAWVLMKWGHEMVDAS
uniref:Uncharacterized protein n=1 Tax=Chromera velia CCMP2878 TaxID=1169474 RepID=A0A0G4GRI6_9ALVE|eukprot:Cvel_23063.t1-p1 / transcript=Cvel_23063.t1 / gene=Cvel_23063 / organism=Chromera_velia_CCMP2878 / gene_product=hypothetical protein / transcript_product=hypothetical protein / location=Cvel_scaffold2334:22724-24819(-) / protein_length=629 / sequence_SO=supercontig / SO=protein_coding / is_pseudo=false